jgi:fermentation-respiration switch protein FrsA (DUF1100 family)
MYFLVGLIAGYVLLVVVLSFAQRSLLYHPDSTTPEPQQYGLDQMEALRISTEDGVQLYAWLQAPSQPEKPMLIYFHGNAGNLGFRAEKVRTYVDAGIGVLMITWRYNAGSGGKPSEPALVIDARAALNFVRDTGVADKQVVVYGESLGSGLAVALAAENHIGAVVLEAPYTTIPDLAQHHYWYVPAKWLVRDRYDSLTHIAEVSSPVMIVHGESDRVVPVKFGRLLFEAAPEPKEAHFIANARHEDLYDHGAAQLVLSFIERHLEHRLEK